jgi:hypothetical protein
MRVAIVGIYVAILVGMVVAVNADAAHGDVVLLVWSVASLLLGWTSRRPLVIVLPLLAIPLSVPFGTSEEWIGSDAPLILFGTVIWSPLQMVLVGLGLGGRTLLEKVRTPAG